MSKIKGLHAKLVKEQFEAALLAKGYKFFASGDYNVNVIGVRSSERRANKFDDMLAVVYKNKGEWEVVTGEITTDPGWAYLKNASSDLGSRGTAILVAGQYSGAYKIDLHRGQYEALCQRLGDVSVYRDTNRDMELDLDPTTIQTGMFGINIHRSVRSGEASDVNLYSAGCQVFKNKSDFDEFMSTLKKSASVWSNKFTYTLINESDLDV